MNRFSKLQFIEFLIMGVLMGLLEDIIAIKLATEAVIDLNVIWIAFLVALPFAALGELVVDHPGFWRALLPERWLKDRRPSKKAE